MRHAIRIGRVLGIDFKIDSSWLVIAALVVWSLSSLFSAWHPEWPWPTRIAVAVAAMLAFFGSVVLHELAHSIVARIYGIPVRDITLHMFGGVSNIEREPPTPAAEFLIAIVGPIASVLLGIGMMAFAVIFTGILHRTQFETAAEAIAHMGPLTTLLMWLGPVNIVVGLFNMVPGFPLDGGRILRSILWRTTGSLSKATKLAASAGQFVGWAFIVTAIFMALGYRVPFFGTGFGPGLWLALIGFFLRNAAVQHRIGVAVEDALSGVRVADIMRTDGPWVNANTPLRAAVSDSFMRYNDNAYPVFEGSSFVGLVSLEDVRRVPADTRDSPLVREIMTPVSDLEVAFPGEGAFEALRRIGNARIGQLPVVLEGQLVGMIFERDLARWLELKSHEHGEDVRLAQPRHA
ncbi:MAG: site-2 protease family protein [Polyangiaceae bacterium]|nr:site-2 protease family protein [Polyangiaceae bacterium]